MLKFVYKQKMDLNLVRFCESKKITHLIYFIRKGALF